MSVHQPVEVTVEQGVLRGERVPAQDGGQPYDAFRGIPYAEKPVGPLRFKAPRPPQPWEGVRPALEEGPMAPQLGPGGKMVGSEDCLYLNVYTPQTPSSQATSSPAPYPIMVWVHVGGFTNGSGSAREYGPDLLVAKNVMVVTFNYRLGPIGFLSLASPAATGNYGLKDMVAALRWVNKNGSAFGGDVNNVTIFGCSAGGAAVLYLQLAPPAQGLFHRAIAQSGTTLSPLLFCPNPRSRSLRLAKEMGATDSDLEDDASIMKYLRSQPAEAFYSAFVRVPVIPEDCAGGLSFTMVPSSEKGLRHDDPWDEAFLLGFPRDLVQQGRINDVPLIAGIVAVEGLIVDAISTAGAIRAIPEVFAKYDRQLELAIPPELRLSFAFPDGSREQKDAVQRIRKLYFNGGAVSEATRNSYYDLQGDILINNGVLGEARAHARKSTHPVHVYCFGVRGKMNRFSHRFGDRYHSLPGACHGDELDYLWTTLPPKPKLDPNSLEARTRHRMVTLWTNFAKTGNPTPEGETTLGGIRWPALPTNVKSSVPFLDIGDCLSVPRGGLFQERLQLWDSLYAEVDRRR